MSKLFGNYEDPQLEIKLFTAEDVMFESITKDPDDNDVDDPFG